MEKLIHDHPERYAQLIIDDENHNSNFVVRNVKGADGQEWAIGKMSVTPDTFGLYKLDEHVDNPDEYPSGQGNGCNVGEQVVFTGHAGIGLCC